MELYNEKTVRELLDKYFDGNTSLEEEHALSDYFALKEVPDDLAYAKVMFARNRATASLDTDMTITPLRGSLTRRIVLSLTSVAAAAVIGLCVWIGVSHERAAAYCYINGIAVNNIEDARSMTREAFDKLDSSLTKVSTSISTVENANRSAEKLEKAISMMTINK